MSSTWNGSTNELRSKTLRRCSDTATEGTVVYQGKFSDLQSAMPGIGGDITIGSVTLKVENVELQQGETDNGVMTVSASDRTTITVDETEWVRVDQDIRYHPNFTSGGMWELDDTDRQDVEAKLNAPNDDSVTTPDGNAGELYTRLLRGETNYAIYIPVCRRTAYYLTNPSVGDGCGQVATPPMTYPSGFTYVLTADRAVRSGWCWQRVREWTGFKTVDTDIVNNAS